MTEWTGADTRANTHTSLYDDSSAAELQETSPLLHISQHRRRWSENVWLVCLALIFIVGVSIGIYLLHIEGAEDTTEKFFLVLRKDWTAQPKDLNMTRLQLPSRRVLLMQTNTSKCWSNSECVRELRSIQKNHIEQLDEPDILYNFVVAGDERLYEGRGWNYRSSFIDAEEELLAIAFLGTYDETSPTDEQINILKAFLDYAVMRGNLIPCYNVLVRNSPSRYLSDIAFDLEEYRKREKDWC